MDRKLVKTNTSPIKEEDHYLIIALAKHGVSNVEIARDFDVTHGTITRILKKYGIFKNSKEGVCAKCGKNGGVYEHHEKYLEVHGVDKTVLLCYTCHKYLHFQLRKANKCTISPETLRKYGKRYRSGKYIKTIPLFRTELFDATYLAERIWYNTSTETIKIHSYFRGYKYNLYVS